MVDAPLPGGSREALVVDGGEDGEPRAEGEEGLCCCGHAHRVRDVPGQGGPTHIQHNARGSNLGRTAEQNSTCARRACPVRVDHSARHRFLCICRGVNEHQTFLHRRRARRQARAAASSTLCSTTLAIGLNDDGNGTEETNQGPAKIGKAENNEGINGIERRASETEKKELLDTLIKLQSMSKELRRDIRKRREMRYPTESEQQHEVGMCSSERVVQRFRRRIEVAAHSLLCGSCGAVPDPMQLVSLPYELGGNTHEMESTVRKTATLLELLTIDRLEDGSYDPSTYSEYWIYKDAVCPVTHTISLCSPCTKESIQFTGTPGAPASKRCIDGLYALGSHFGMAHSVPV